MLWQESFSAAVLFGSEPSPTRRISDKSKPAANAEPLEAAFRCVGDVTGRGGGDDANETDPELATRVLKSKYVAVAKKVTLKLFSLQIKKFVSSQSPSGPFSAFVMSFVRHTAD